MSLLTISNLYPRPDQSGRGIFNAQLFGALAARVPVRNICLVPEWRVWRWRAVRRWRPPGDRAVTTRYLPVFYVPAVGRGFSRLTYTAALRRVAGEFEENDAVLATWLYPDGVAAARVGAEHGKPVWIKVHGSDLGHLENAGRARAIREACRGVAGFICNCAAVGDRLGGICGRATVVRNGVDPARFRYRDGRAARAELAGTAAGAKAVIGGGRRLILFAGNLVPVKGPDVLLEAWGLALQAGFGRGPDPGAMPPLLAVLGDGPWRGRLERRSRAPGFADSVCFAGRRPHSEMPLWMNLADCLCVSSRSEGVPNVLVEALASGLPAVATDVGGVAETAAGEPACLLVPAEDPAALAAGMVRALSLSVDRKGLADRFGRRYSLAGQADAVLEEISDCRA